VGGRNYRYGMSASESEQRTPTPQSDTLEKKQNQTIMVTGMSNREFLELYARPGRIGLSGGITWIDKVICRAERHLDESENWGLWSHAFLFQGRRHDAHHWVIESDLQVHRKHIQLGVQENRVTKYFDETLYTNLAILDFGLSEESVNSLLREGLELVATRTKYSVRELVGTLIALRRPGMRQKNNVLSRDCSMYCSAFVHHLFRRVGLDLAAGIDLKNTTPEDISRTSTPHVTWLLQRQVLSSRVKALRTKIKQRAKLRLRQLQRKPKADI
jgi:hypothetical protein